MYKPLSMYIGLRYFKAKRRNGFISFISFSSTIGIMLGTAVLIIGLSMMNGFEHQLKDRLLAYIPNAELEMVNFPISNWQLLSQEAKKHPKITATAPYVKRNALLDLGNKLKALQIKGIIPNYEERVTQISDFVPKEVWGKLVASENQIIVGNSLKKLGLKQGDVITLLLPNNSASLKLKAPIRARFRVAGFSSFGGQVGASTAYVHLHDLQDIVGMGQQVTGVALKVSDVMNADKILGEVGGSLSTMVYLRSWKTTQGFLYNDILMVKSIMYVILLLVVAVACFNIVSTLVMAVKDKKSDIAILKTMGASNRLIQLIFISQGLINAIAGAALGAFFGVLIALNLSDLLKGLENYLGIKLLSGDIYFIDFIPSQLHWPDVYIVVFCALIMGFLSTIYPAFAASRTQPARELGHH